MSLWSIKRSRMANNAFYSSEKSRKRYGFLIFSYLKDRLSLFTAVKRDAKF